MRVKVYVGCGLTHAPKKFRESVFKLKEILREDPGLEVLDFISYPNTSSPREVYQRDVVECVGTADLLLAISGYPSTGLGYEMATMIEARSLPVLEVAHRRSRVTSLIIDIPHPQFLFVRYDHLAKDVPSILNRRIRELWPREKNLFTEKMEDVA